jgi:hypothetical protein
MKAVALFLVPILIASGCIGQAEELERLDIIDREQPAEEPVVEIGPQPGEQPPAGTASGNVIVRSPICKLVRIGTDNKRYFRIESAGSVSGTTGVALRVSYSGDFAVTGTQRSLDCVAWTEFAGGNECRREPGEPATSSWEGIWSEHVLDPAAGQASVTVKVKGELYSPGGALLDSEEMSTRCQ